MTTELRSYVGGNWRDGVRRVEDINPANPQEIVAEVSMGNASLAVAAVEAADAAAASWRSIPAPTRGEILRKAADLLEQRATTVGRDLTREEGKTLTEGIGETKRAVAILRYYAGLTLDADGETYPSHSSRTFLYARREPIGVVAVITPWNFPIAIPAWKIAPALAYGNTVVWKPAELVPLTAMHLLQAFIDAGLPKGVLNMVLGKGSEVGEVLTTHEGIDAITFTGSNPVGRAIQRQAIEHGKKVQLERGGKNPSVVLADANLPYAVEQVARGAFLSAGQKCTATSRVIVEKPIVEEPFGLTASLFTNDLTKALRFVNDIRVGVVKINQESAGLEYQVPFGGAKESSSGSREQGQAAKEFFTQWKTVYMDQLPTG